MSKIKTILILSWLHYQISQKFTRKCSAKQSSFFCWSRHEFLYQILSCVTDSIIHDFIFGTSKVSLCRGDEFYQANCIFYFVVKPKWFMCRKNFSCGLPSEFITNNSAFLCDSMEFFYRNRMNGIFFMCTQQQ